jgi:NADPH:quinone reductase-like Zn-dependent oxidoreductase
MNDMQACHERRASILSKSEQVGAGVKDLREGDHVLPVKSHAGTWRNLAVWKTKDLLKAGPPIKAHGHMLSA